MAKDGKTDDMNPQGALSKSRYRDHSDTGKLIMSKKREAEIIRQRQLEQQRQNAPQRK